MRGRGSRQERSARRARAAWVAAVTALLVAGSAWAAGEAIQVPDGWGKARFGMSEAELLAFYPKLTKLWESRPQEDVTTAIPRISMFELTGQKVLEKSDCTIGFKFAEDQLYFVQMNCGQDASIRQMLVRAYKGEPLEIQGALYWFGEERAVSLNPKSMQFAYFDRKLDEAVQQAVIGALQREGQIPQ